MQVQPVPLRLVAVKTPLPGRTSVTVTVPLAAAEPLFVTPIEYCPLPFGAKLLDCDKAIVHVAGSETLLLDPPHAALATVRQIRQKKGRSCLSRIIRKGPETRKLKIRET